MSSQNNWSGQMGHTWVLPIKSFPVVMTLVCGNAVTHLFWWCGWRLFEVGVGKGMNIYQRTVLVLLLHCFGSRWRQLWNSYGRDALEYLSSDRKEPSLLMTQRMLESFWKGWSYSTTWEMFLCCCHVACSCVCTKPELPSGVELHLWSSSEDHRGTRWKQTIQKRTSSPNIPLPWVKSWRILDRNWSSDDY